MGSQQFQNEYIDYLVGKNSELLDRLSQLKENYENVVFSKDLNKQYIFSILKDALNLCSTLPQEIDLFFDKLSAAMGVLTNVLIKKSEMVQLAEKITNILNATENITTELQENCVQNFIKETIESKNTEKKGGTVKVSPMINGHVISTGPRICLNRVPEDALYSTRKESCLSPIIEASPDNSDSLPRRRFLLKEPRIPLKRICFNNLSYKVFEEASPNIQPSGEKDWRKSASPNKEEKETESADIDKKEVIQNNIDPLEGPSWLYDENRFSVGPSPSKVTSPCYVDYRRRKQRFATVFEKNRNSISVRLSNEKKENSALGSRNSSANMGTTKSDGEISSVESKKINDSHRDFISESTDHDESDWSDSENVPLSSDRKSFDGSRDDNDFKDFAKDIKDRESTPYAKRKKSLIKNNYSNERDSNKRSSLRKSVNNSSEKDLSKLSSRESRVVKSAKSDRKNKFSSSFQNDTPKKLTKKPRSKNRKSKKQRTSNLTMGEVVIKLDDCKTSKTFKAMLIKASSSGEKKKSDSWSPFTFESGDKRRRKAAPTNLTEPKLKTKLRRG